MRGMNKLLFFVLMAIMLSGLVFAADISVPSISEPITGQVVFTTVDINWTEAVASNETHYVSAYNITVLNSSTDSLVHWWTVADVANTTFTYVLNMTSNVSGYYTVGVEAITNDSFSPTGYSGNFTLDHTAPTVSGVAVNTNLAGYYTVATLTCGGTYDDAPFDTAESGSTYRWFVDDAVVAGQTASTYTGTQTDGTTILCEYTPSDGYNTGTASNASAVTLTTVEATGCATTKATIYAAFALIAVGIIVLAGFMIIQLFKGDVGGTEVLMAVVVGSIAIGIVVMVGYFLIDKIAESVCTLG